MAALICAPYGAPAEQCNWLPGQGIPGTTLFGVSAATLWDPDGPGPDAELLVVGGRLEGAGEVVSFNVATWNRTAWQPLGAGTNDRVAALTVCYGKLIAAGDFTVAGGASCNYIARWDGWIGDERK